MDPTTFSSTSPGRLVEATDDRGGRGSAFVPGLLPVDLDLGSRELRLALSAADRELARLDGIAYQSDQADRLFSNYLRREAVLSSAIEGTRTSLAELVLFQVTDAEQTPDDRTVDNYVKALRYGLDRVCEVPLGRTLFCELHQILMANESERDKTPGRVRDCQVFLGEAGFERARFVAPPPLFIDELLQNLDDYLRNEREAHLLKIAIAHYQFEAIHPFRDGNGRVGRLMISLYLRKHEILSSPLLYLSAFFDKKKREYYDHLLQVSTQGAWSDWLLFFLHAVESQARDSALRSRKLSELRIAYRDRLRGPRSSAGPLQLVDRLFENPAVSIPMAAEALGVSYPAAQATVRKLVAAGILDETAFRARGTNYYVAKELIDAIESPLDGGS